MLIIPGVHSVSTTMCLWVNLHSGSRLIINLLSRDIINVIFTFLYAKPGYMPGTVGKFFTVKSLPKALLISRQVNVKLQPLVWACNQKPCSFMALWGRCWGQNMAHNYKLYVSPAMGSRVTNNWCINGETTCILLWLWLGLPPWGWGGYWSIKLEWVFRPQTLF